MLKGKSFKHIATGKTVMVKDHFENIVILDDNTKIKSSDLLNTNIFSENRPGGFVNETVDPNEFFNNNAFFESFTNQIKNIPTNHIVDENGSSNVSNIFKDDRFSPATNESAVIQSDPEWEKQELMRKYNINNNTQPKPTTSINDIVNSFDNVQNNVEKVEVNRVEVQREEVVQKVQEAPKQVKSEDPILTMFKNIKRKNNFNVTIDFMDKIPRSDFIEMMEDSYNVSLIDFLAEEFTNKILSDPNSIKQKIIGEINKIVYGENIDDLDDETILETEIEVIDTETDSEKEEVVDSVDSSDLDVKKLEETEND